MEGKSIACDASAHEMTLPPYSSPGVSRVSGRVSVARHRVFGRTRWVCVALAAACACIPGATRAESTSIPAANQPLVGPQATLDRLARAYRDRKPDDVIATYTADYRFHSMGDSLLNYSLGMTRSDDSSSVRNMMLGEIRNGETLIAPADSIGLTMDGFEEGADPEHPDSLQHYRTVAVGRYDFGVRVGNDRMLNTSSLHVFHLVRGDAAVLVAGQSADAEHWYIRRWLENVGGVRDLLGRESGDCGESAAPVRGPGTPPVAVAPGRPGTGVLAIRPLTNPACAALNVTCELPGNEPARVEVYDVSGRLVNRRPVPVAKAGEVTVEAGRGARILPGVYWVRLTQASRRPSTRMVVVAR